MKRVLLVKKRGYNYYTDYTELYFHRFFSDYGYSVVRDKSKGNFSVLVYISESEKYMQMISPLFDELAESDISSFCESFSKIFKSEVMMSELKDNMLYSVRPYECMFSDKFSAYDEPVFLSEECPKLRWPTRDVYFKANEAYYISFVSIGGKISGINIIFEFRENISDLVLSDAEVSYYKDKNEIKRSIFFEKNGSIIKASVDFLEISEGVNPMSAILLGKKKADTESYHGFYLKLLPVVNDDVVFHPTLIITSDDAEIFRINL